MFVNFSCCYLHLGSDLGYVSINANLHGFRVCEVGVFFGNHKYTLLCAYDVTICRLEQVQGHVSSLLLTLTALVTTIADQLAKVACDSSSNGVVTMVADIMNKWVQEAQEKNEKLKDEIHSQSECPEMVS